MQSPPTPSAHDSREPMSVRPATLLLRELLEVTAAFEKSLGSALSVNPTDLDAMQHLLMSGPLSPTELSRRVGLSSAATTTSIDRLAALGHVTREPNPRDRRSVLVRPSPASRAKAMSRLIPMITSIDESLNDFGAEEQAVITRYLERVVGQYRHHANGGAGGAGGADGDGSAASADMVDRAALG